MRSYRTEAQIGQNGERRLTKLPFQQGEEVDVILLPKKTQPKAANDYPLRGQSIRYEGSFKPMQ